MVTERNDIKNITRQRIITPVIKPLRIAGWLSVVAGALWAVQAAALAFVVAGWAEDGVSWNRVWLVATIFVGVAIVRAALEHRSAALLYEAADKTIARERVGLINREARAKADIGSAAIASLIVQKLPLLQPWITRYHVSMMRARILPLFFVSLAFSQSWIVGITLLVAGPLIPVFMALVGMAAEDASKRQMDEIGTMNDMVMDRLSAMLDIRLLGAVDEAANDFDDRAQSLRAKTMAVLRVAFLSSTVLELFSALGVAMVAVFVGFTLLGEITFGFWGNELGLGQGLFLLLIAPEFFQPLRQLAAAWHDRAAGFAVVAELEALDSANRVSFVGQGALVAPMDGALSVVAKGVRVRLGNQHIDLPDLELRQGQSIALTGPSGVGKTTALAALSGLVPLDAGTLTVCNQMLDEQTADAWRQRVGLMPQKPHFSDHTLFNWLDIRGTGADPWPALRLADADDIVEHLPNGLDARLGETGGGVSGGEARRLLLARTINTGADLIIADEPTADLDTETAMRVIQALKRLQAQGHTIIVATHDNALADAMDRRLEMQL